MMMFIMIKYYVTSHSVLLKIWKYCLIYNRYQHELFSMVYKTVDEASPGGVIKSEIMPSKQQLAKVIYIYIYEYRGFKSHSGHFLYSKESVSGEYHVYICVYIYIYIYMVQI